MVYILHTFGQNNRTKLRIPLARTLQSAAIWPKSILSHFYSFRRSHFYTLFLCPKSRLHFIPLAEVTFTLHSFGRSHVYTLFLWPKSVLHFIPLAEVASTLYSFGRIRFIHIIRHLLPKPPGARTHGTHVSCIIHW